MTAVNEETRCECNPGHHGRGQPDAESAHCVQGKRGIEGRRPVGMEQTGEMCARENIKEVLEGYRMWARIRSRSIYPGYHSKFY